MAKVVTVEKVRMQRIYWVPAMTKLDAECLVCEAAFPPQEQSVIGNEIESIEVMEAR